MRLTKIEYGLLMALTASRRSEDPTTKVGCVVENYDGRIIASGYNGLKAKKKSRINFARNRNKKLEMFIHSEVNALSLVKRGEAARIYSTHSPCAACCHTIIAHGINEVIFLKEYHACQKYKSILKENGIRFRAAKTKEVLHIRNSIRDMCNLLE